MTVVIALFLLGIFLLLAKDTVSSIPTNADARWQFFF